MRGSYVDIFVPSTTLIRMANRAIVDTEVLVIGSGIAGLSFALKMAAAARVLVITKKESATSNTNHAKGGIAVALGDDDSPDLHVRDTLATGSGLSHREAVEVLAAEGPERVRELVAWGTAFDHTGERLSLAMEGGHSRRRIAYHGDDTGRAIESALIRAVEGTPNIDVWEDHVAVDLLVASGARPETRRCVGAIVLDHHGRRLIEVRARVTLLASGGCGQVYVHTTNPGIATGDGIAIARRAGARVGNMEFVQFHPTALFPTEDPAFLISETVRGEGAILRRGDGVPIMNGYDPRGSLAPRDVVARALDTELRKRGETHAILDVSAIAPDTFAARFPGTLEGCRSRGVDPMRDGIPVVPAAHYSCGGVFTDFDARTSLDGLYAAGEVACTGVHGANRLASNSLLEAVVFSHRAALAVTQELTRDQASSLVVEPSLTATGGGRPLDDVEEARKHLRALMWELVGIVRTDARLQKAERELSRMSLEHDASPISECPTIEAIELANLIECARLIVRCALWRRESRGLHFNTDHPETDDEGFLRDSVATGMAEVS
ncbi:MAG: L-aspartate oxidase [Gemmatimonadota bacterium]|nr:MAG: L-aspartate oxidase [Gemmatimonadota bacterium]